jgi:hypothetical protein
MATQAFYGYVKGNLGVAKSHGYGILGVSLLVSTGELPSSRHRKRHNLLPMYFFLVHSGSVE